MTTRENILSAVRKGLGGKTPDPAAIDAAAAALLADPDAIRPALSAGTLIDAFCTKSEVLGTTVDRITGFENVPGAVQRYLDSQGLAGDVALEPAEAFGALDWGKIGSHATIAPDEAAAVALARWGIAESGSFVIHSSPETPILFAFLPLHHIVVLRAETILAHLEDYAALVGTGERPPRNAILITGPSGTTDIEGSYVRGAHGPGFVHVVLVENA